MQNSLTVFVVVLLTVAEAQAAAKVGECPKNKPNEVGFCVEECKNDRECPGKEKCCKNPCGALTCRYPRGSMIECPTFSCSAGPNVPCALKQLPDEACPSCFCETPDQKPRGKKLQAACKVVGGTCKLYKKGGAQDAYLCNAKETCRFHK